MSVNMETHAARPGKQRSKINIDVNLERTLTKTSCMEIVEDLLKYILYQRRQIPVQFEVLAREVARAEREAGLHSLDATSTATREKNENQVGNYYNLPLLIFMKVSLMFSPLLIHIFVGRRVPPGGT